MSRNDLTQEEKMLMWFRGKRGFNMAQSGTSKLLENFKICNESGYFLQAAKLRKEIYKRGYQEKFDSTPLQKIPDEYYTTHTPENITSDIIEFINAYITEEGDSVSSSGLLVGKDNGVLYYGWDEMIDCDLKIDTTKNLAIFTGIGEIDYTKELDKTLELIKSELFHEGE